jgi:hypothetical protein
VDSRGRKWQKAAEHCIIRKFITCKLHQVKEDDIGRACSTHGEMRNVYKILVRNPEVKRLLRRSRCRWEYKIRIDLGTCRLDAFGSG